MTPSLKNSLVVSLLCLAACLAPGGHEEPAWAPLLAEEMGSMSTVAYAEPLWFGSAPGGDDLRLARRRGVERVIALGEGAGGDLRGVAEEVGLTWLSLPVAAEEVGDARVDEVLALLRAPERTLMFCGDGRASAALFAIHRAAQVGLPLEAALEEARRAGLDPDLGPELVRRQVLRLAAAKP